MDQVITIGKTGHPVADWVELPDQPLVSIEPDVTQAIREGALNHPHSLVNPSLFVSFTSDRPISQGTVFTANQDNYEVISSVGKYHKAKLL